jgi:hypothetical protein
MLRHLAPLLAAAIACSTTDPPTSPTREHPAFEPPPLTAWRLTDRQLRATWAQLTGVTWEGELPGDLALHGYTHVGASELTVPPVELELYDVAAWGVASAWLRDGPSTAQVVGCEDLLGASPERAEACVRGWTVGLAEEAFRRAVSREELDELMWLYEEVAGLAGRQVAVQAVAVAVLQSPDLLFRVEFGEPDPERPGWRQVRGRELANRLAYTLTDAPPDEALLELARSGSLDDPEVLATEARRLIASPAGHASLLRWWEETLQLDGLALVDKDPVSVGVLTDALKAAMKREVTWLFEHVVLDEGEDIATLLTTNATWLEPELAELYGQGFTGQGEIGEAFGRGGLLGRAAILAQHAHPSSTSPTHRGRFVRMRLLCHSVPPPPPGVVASLEEVPEGGTLRQRLERHMEDPACNSCHKPMDPIGFGLEGFDALGKRRISDGGLALDTTGEIDGVAFDGAVELGQAVAAHEDLYGCMTLQLVRHALGQAEAPEQLRAVDRLTEAMRGHEGRLEAVVEALVQDEVFRAAKAPVGEACTDEQEGETRACSTGCGEGSERCSEGIWSGCDAPAPATEQCDGVDQDCDGLPDPALVRACDAEHGPGVQACEAGAWASCLGPEAPVETCNGEDDDGDSEIDEGLDIELRPSSASELAAAHDACDPTLDAASPTCHAANHRACVASGCAVSGFGPVGSTPGVWDQACLASSEATVVWTSFTELATHHSTCTQAETHGGPCNAAISRLCGSRGLGTGFGPVEHSGDGATVVCTPGAVVLTATYTELSGSQPVCDGSSQRWGAECSMAISAWCQGQGYRTGHGPLENTGDEAWVACLGAP